MLASGVKSKRKQKSDQNRKDHLRMSKAADLHRPHLHAVEAVVVQTEEEEVEVVSFFT